MNRALNRGSPSESRHGDNGGGRRRTSQTMAFDESFSRFSLDKTTLIGDSVKDIHQSKYGKGRGKAGGRKVGAMRRLVRQLPIVGLMLLIGLGYYVYVFALCYWHLWRRKFYWTAVSYAAGGHVLLLMLLWSFLKAAYSHPGHLSRYASAPSDGPWCDWSECGRCGKNRPPRAHHCSKCDTCITKMDHHCTLLDNCVGWGNQKSFLLATTYAALMMIYGTSTLLLKYVIVGFTGLLNIETQLAVGAFLGVFFTSLTSLFSALHWLRLFQNMTLLEEEERKEQYRQYADVEYPHCRGKEKHLAAAPDLIAFESLLDEYYGSGMVGNIVDPNNGKEVIPWHKYDVGPWRNFTSIFGRNALLWPLPINSGHRWQGLAFSVRAAS